MSLYWARNVYLRKKPNKDYVKCSLVSRLELFCSGYLLVEVFSKHHFCDSGVVFLLPHAEKLRYCMNDLGFQCIEMISKS